MKKITIAIDGHSSTGKSTLAKALARALNYAYVDTGAMYRCVALYALESGFLQGDKIDEVGIIASLEKIQISFLADPKSGQNITFLNGQNVEEKIRTMRVSKVVSPVAAMPEVRKHLVKLQQEMGKSKAVVMDGRDIGTVVFPNAELKIFMTASAEVRAQRRFDELKNKGQKVKFAEVLKNLEERDQLDSNRADSPLRKADDALVLDNSNLTAKEQFDIALNWSKKAAEI